jgi:hypothetical protein
MGSPPGRLDQAFDATTEADTDDVAIIHVCAGPPYCSLEGDDAVAAQIAGCVWCRRIAIDAVGHEHDIGPGHA